MQKLVFFSGHLDKYTDKDTDNSDNQDNLFLTKFLTFCIKNTGHHAQAQAKDQDQYLQADQLYRDIINARTFPEIQAAIYAAAQINYNANLQLVREQSTPRLEQLIMGPEGTGGLLTQNRV